MPYLRGTSRAARVPTDVLRQKLSRLQAQRRNYRGGVAGRVVAGRRTGLFWRSFAKIWTFFCIIRLLRVYPFHNFRRDISVILCSYWGMKLYKVKFCVEACVIGFFLRNCLAFWAKGRCLVLNFLLMCSGSGC